MSLKVSFHAARWHLPIDLYTMGSESDIANKYGVRRYDIHRCIQLVLTL